MSKDFKFKIERCTHVQYYAIFKLTTQNVDGFLPDSVLKAAGPDLQILDPVIELTSK